jgi:hypothetical protein
MLGYPRAHGKVEKRHVRPFDSILKSIAVLGLCQITEIDLRSSSDPSAGMRDTIEIQLGDHASWNIATRFYEFSYNVSMTYLDNTIECSACSNSRRCFGHRNRF